MVSWKSPLFFSKFWTKPLQISHNSVNGLDSSCIITFDLKFTWYNDTLFGSEYHRIIVLVWEKYLRCFSCYIFWVLFIFIMLVPLWKYSWSDTKHNEHLFALGIETTSNFIELQNLLFFFFCININFFFVYFVISMYYYLVQIFK